MIKPIIAANWKMNKTVAESVDFSLRLAKECEGLEEREVIIAPPATALYAVSQALKGSTVHLSAQNMHWEEKGAFTGEISAPMLADMGCEYVLIGHSERRTLFGETNEAVNKKLKAALNFGLKPIVCIGETLEERESEATFDVIKKQVKEGLNNISTGDIECVSIAYEPVWAIGTGKTATPELAEEVHQFIREILSSGFGEGVGAETAIIYGGSVTPQNIGELMDKPNINGALVGGASLDVESFTGIIRY
jgi:triosephosphate isomerase